MAGKCPACGKLVISLHGHTLSMTVGQHRYNCVTYQCPSCQVVLGCELDPIDLQTGIVNEVTKQVKKLLGQ